MPQRLARLLISAGTLLILLFAPLPARADSPANDHFQRTWAHTDQPVSSGMVDRTWIWGPAANTGPLVEAYDETPGGLRVVQYYDKSRMEINNPDAIDDGLWYVTNGLLAEELMTGQMQVGDASFETRAPSTEAVAGDPNPYTVNYGVFADAIDEPAYPGGSVLIGVAEMFGGSPQNPWYLDIGDDPAMAQYGVTAAYFVPQTQHQVASVFWDFMNSSGLVYQNGGYTNDRLFVDPFYATGYPLTEAYWMNVPVAGTYKMVLVQCFERRCLTYTPDNPNGWKVEFGNVGQHYYEWRYGTTPPTPLDTHQLTFISERDGNAEIYLVNADGSGLQNLSRNSANDNSVSWAPDGSKLAFISDRSGSPDVWVMNADGGDPQDLTPGLDPEFTPAWSPDGRYIAYQRGDGGDAEIYVMDADGSNQLDLTNNSAVDVDPVWSPDSTRIAFRSDRDEIVPRWMSVYTMKVDGSDVQPVQTCWENNTSVAWSPDGEQLALLSGTYNTGLLDFCQVQLDTDTPGPLLDVTLNPRSGPVWAPDGSLVAGAYAEIDSDSGEYVDYLFVAIPGGHPQVVAEGTFEEQPSWSEDGTYLAWTSARNGNHDIVVADDSGGQQHVVAASTANDSNPVWRPLPVPVG